MQAKIGRRKFRWHLVRCLAKLWLKQMLFPKPKQWQKLVGDIFVLIRSWPQR